MRYSVTYRGYKQSGGVISLPPDPPLSTSLSHLFFKEICPIDGGNYIGTLTQYLGMRKVNVRVLAGANNVMLMTATAYNIKKLLKFKTNFAKSQAKALVLSYLQIKTCIKVILAILRHLNCSIKNTNFYHETDLKPLILCRLLVFFGGCATATIISGMFFMIVPNEIHSCQNSSSPNHFSE